MDSKQNPLLKPGEKFIDPEQPKLIIHTHSTRDIGHYDYREGGVINHQKGNPAQGLFQFADTYWKSDRESEPDTQPDFPVTPTEMI